MNQEQRGQMAFKLDEAIKENENQRRKLLADNAELLFEMFEKKYYHEVLGDEKAKWAGYLAQTEVFYTRSQVEMLTRCYKKLSLQLGIPKEAWIEVPLTRLTDMLPIVDEKNYENLFTKALVLTPRDWKIEIRKAKGQTTEDDDHQHDNEIYEICKKCGRKAPHHHA